MDADTDTPPRAGLTHKVCGTADGCKEVVSLLPVLSQRLARLHPGPAYLGPRGKKY